MLLARRSRFEIYIDILNAVREGRQKPTRIMYRANLTWTRLKKHLEFLIEQDFLVEKKINGSSRYFLTVRGKEVLEYHRRVEMELHQLGKTAPAEPRVLRVF
ncbi:hypothetical protein B6U79_02200 [Candidatus Bathyarchaeota archaeon ex4484_231]|nr:MAG: hypothetical protein B6U79_02200 [Candidatus Bathyarchaeota archaeon ex4484_231]RJS76694.1 MAG: hypothetical protein CW712_00930 [Candidatus Bathyarchaeota archaeon]